MRTAEKTDAVDDEPPRSVSRRKSGLVRALFLGVTLFFVVQQLVIEVWGEPFPGLTLPSFASPIQADTVDRRVPTIEAQFADGGVETLSERRLVGRSPAGPSHVVNSMFWFGPRKVDGGWVVEDRDAVRWIRGRLQELYPTRVATGLTVAWTKRAIRLDGTIDDDRTQALRLIHVSL